MMMMMMMMMMMSVTTCYTPRHQSAAQSLPNSPGSLAGMRWMVVVARRSERLGHSSGKVRCSTGHDRDTNLASILPPVSLSWPSLAWAIWTYEAEGGGPERERGGKGWGRIVCHFATFTSMPGIQLGSLSACPVGAVHTVQYVECHCHCHPPGIHQNGPPVGACFARQWYGRARAPTGVYQRTTQHRN
ncbi:hypothetical protein BO99DRAFT_77691 [Aspergillus violaceofuscus CBS 115571]|uniref:Secreted protein n=1 Tax=Aspergillus violaceofuscus (strain CBS 115571) TaxID=1450538 RepID=A0A2V5HYT6_ASPV1|nr:hypothetical protein BO99DRAFT_77691 [Aspergillus violaceofuscus CBS 115571]